MRITALRSTHPDQGHGVVQPGSTLGYGRNRLQAEASAVCAGCSLPHFALVEVQLLQFLMPGAHVRIVVLRKWFPPHDPLAAKMARICILREDLLLEMQGVYTEDIRELDGLSPQYRRMYFLRNLMRSQMELS